MARYQIEITDTELDELQNLARLASSFMPHNQHLVHALNVVISKVLIEKIKQIEPDSSGQPN